MIMTLDIDADIVETIEYFSEQLEQPTGKVVSNLLREALTDAREPSVVVNGFELLPARRGVVITPEFVQAVLEKAEMRG